MLRPVLKCDLRTAVLWFTEGDENKQLGITNISVLFFGGSFLSESTEHNT